MMNKKCLALAISTIMLCGAESALAVVDLDAAPNPALYTQEIIVPTTALNPITDTTGSDNIDVQHDIQFGLSPTQDRYIRYDLTNATWGRDLVIADLSTPSNASTVVSIAFGGLDDENFVIFHITAGPGATDDIAPADHILLNIDDLNVLNQSAVTIQYQQFDSSDALGAQANDASLVLASATNTLLDFPSNALLLTCTPAPFEAIDVLTGSILFDGSIGTVNEVVPGSVQVTVNTVLLGIDSVPLPDADEIIASAGMSITGLATGISGVTDTAPPTYTLTGGVWGSTNGPLSAYSALIPVDAVASGTGPLNTSTVGISVVNAIAQPGYSNASINNTTCTLGGLIKNGSQDRVMFLLTPRTSNPNAFKNFVRITNPSGTTGDVQLILTDDDGVSASFALGDISGIPSNTLNAGASTKLINIDDLAAAASIANSSIDVSEKLRLDVFGEFGARAFNSSLFNQVSPGLGLSGSLHGLDGISGKDGINVQSFSMDRNNDSFFMMAKD